MFQQVEVRKASHSVIFTAAVVLDLLIVAAVTADLGQHLSLQVYKSVFVLARRICLYRLINAVASLGHVKRHS